MTTAVVVSLGILALITYVMYANKHTKNLMHIGLAASQAYLYHGSNECRLAALTTKSILAAPLGKKMIYYVESVSCPLEGADRSEFEARKKDLVHSLLMQESGVAASAKRKTELDGISPDWHRAIAKADRTIAERLFAEGASRHAGEHATR